MSCIVWARGRTLKVLLIDQISLYSCLCSLLLAKFWVHIRDGLQLYHARYMGGHINIHIYIKSPEVIADSEPSVVLIRVDKSVKCEI